MRRKPMKRTGWARSSTTVPSTAKKPRNVVVQPVNSTPDAIKSDEVCDFVQVVRNMPPALAGKAHAAIKSVAKSPISPTTVKRPNQHAQT